MLRYNHRFNTFTKSYYVYINLIVPKTNYNNFISYVLLKLGPTINYESTALNTKPHVTLDEILLDDRVLYPLILVATMFREIMRWHAEQHAPLPVHLSHTVWMTVHRRFCVRGSAHYTQNKHQDHMSVNFANLKCLMDYEIKILPNILFYVFQINFSSCNSIFRALFCGFVSVKIWIIQFI